MTRKEKSILQTISENTNEFLKLKPVLYYEAIDFLTVRLDICPFLRTLNGLVENSDSFILENGFKIQFFGLVA